MSSGNPGASKEPLQSKELQRLLEIIDNLRECGVSEDISLPQLVVVGDQSSGKSSILEAITRIPFPVASTLCTRFATQISFRRSSETKMTTTIIPAKSSSRERKKKLREFSHVVEELTGEDFANILEEASDIMGLPKPGKELSELEYPTGARFSDDILKLELQGPKLSHFSVVDVPGLFQSATTYQTDEDAVIVEELVKRYIQDERTIILAVASSLHETANQKVFRLATEADPKGARTVGVLTKPDAVQAGDEARVIEVALNKVTPLTHGWFMVRNRSTDEVRKGVTIQQRHENESKFFQKDPWTTLDADRLGIKSLETYLRRLLLDHIRREFPNLVRELEGILNDCREQLKGLGEPRETSDQQRQVLTKISMEFQFSVKNALIGYYDFPVPDRCLKLRMLIQDLNDKFSRNVQVAGHTMSFEDTSGVKDWIRNEYKESRGVKIPGMVNPWVVQALFKMQSENWKKLAPDHILEVKSVVETFNRELLRVKCRDDTLRSKIWANLRSVYNSAYKKADDELAQILKDERGGILITYNSNYTESLKDSRRERMGFRLPFSFLNSKTSTGRTFSSDPEELEVDYIYDVLKSYYDVAWRRFVDCVSIQVVERHFLGSHGPVCVFSPEFIAALSVEELENIAGEDLVVSSKRKTLAAKAELLERAQEIARGGFCET